MNVFKTLSQGNGRISETNITSFLSYLLDSNNELRNSFFYLFIQLIDSHIVENKVSDLLNLKGKSTREKIISFTKDYVVSSEPEHSIKGDDGTRQIPDILVRISSRKTEEEVALFIIENKVSRNAIKKGQIESQLEYFEKSDDYVNCKNIYSILITPDEEIFKPIYESAHSKNNNTIWLKWVNNNSELESIEKTLKKLIIFEHNAEIEPIDINTQFILKSFIDFIATEFSYKENGKRNSSINGFDLLVEAVAELNNKNYYIRRYSNNMIRIFDENENELDVKIKPLLREINNKYNLNINLNHTTGKEKNTQVLGKEIIVELNQK